MGVLVNVLRYVVELRDLVFLKGKIECVIKIIDWEIILMNMIV